MFNLNYIFQFTRNRHLQFIIFFFAIHLISMDASAQVSKGTSGSTLSWQGSYYGITPCADCPGIAIRLTLMKGCRYQLLVHYLEAAVKEDTFTGNFVWKGNIIILNGIQGAWSKFKVGNNKVIVLTPEGKTINDDLAQLMVLYRIGDRRIENKRWKLITLHGKVIASAIDDPYLILHKNDGVAESKAGCNQLRHPYVVTANNRIYFNPGISTLMACPNLEIEEQLNQVLLQAHHYRLATPHLVFYNANQQSLATFSLCPAIQREWWIGKTFIQEHTNEEDPILGGASFLRLETKETSSIKFGDIVYNCSTICTNNKLIVVDKLTNKRYTFTMVHDTYLVDEQGLKWICNN